MLAIVSGAAIVTDCCISPCVWLVVLYERVIADRIDWLIIYLTALATESIVTVPPVVGENVVPDSFCNTKASLSNFTANATAEEYTLASVASSVVGVTSRI